MIGTVIILPVIELGKRDGTVQSRWLKSGGLETLRAGGPRWGNEIAGVVSGDYHGRRVGEEWYGCGLFIQSREPVSLRN